MAEPTMKCRKQDRQLSQHDALARPCRSLVLYRWRYRDERTGKPRETTYRLTEENARRQYGDRLIGPVEYTRELRQVDPGRAHFSPFKGK